MAVFKQPIITTAGLNLITEAYTGGYTFTPVEARLISVDISSLTDAEVKALTTLTTSLSVAVSNTKSNTTITSQAIFTNATLQSNLTIYGIGLYATSSKYAVGTKTLYAVVVATTPDLLVAYDSHNVVTKKYNINTVMTDATQISVSINPPGVATEDILNSLSNSTIAKLTVHSTDQTNYDSATGIYTYQVSAPAGAMPTVYRWYQTGMTASALKLNDYYFNGIDDIEDDIATAGANAKFYIYTKVQITSDFYLGVEVASDAINS